MSCLWRLLASTTLSICLAIQPIQSQDSGEAQPPLLTLDGKGPVGTIIKELQSQARCIFRVESDVQAREIEIHKKGVGFFEALDAVCRSHGEMSYLGLRRPRKLADGLELGRQSWLEYPSHYVGHCKVMISHFNDHQIILPNRAGWSEVGVKLLAPPWLTLSRTKGVKVVCTVTEAIAADGTPLPTDQGDHSVRQCVYVSPHFPWYPNSIDYSLTLRRFPIETGLRVLSGKFLITTTDTTTARITLEEGDSLDLHEGKLLVKSLDTLHDSPRGKYHRVTFEYQPAPNIQPTSLKYLVDEVGRYEGGPDEWKALRIVWSEASFDLEIPADRAPRWVDLRLKRKPRTVELPFHFKDLRLNETR